MGMKFEVSIEKRYAFAFVACVLVLAGAFYVYAVAPNPGHEGGQVNVNIPNVGEKSLQQAINDGDFSGGAGAVSFGCFAVSEYNDCKPFYPQGFNYIFGANLSEPAYQCCTASSEFEVKEIYAVFDSSGGGDPDCWVVSENRYSRSYKMPSGCQNVPPPSGHLEPKDRATCVAAAVDYYNTLDIDGRTGGWELINEDVIKANLAGTDPCGKDDSSQFVSIGVKRPLV